MSTFFMHGARSRLILGLISVQVLSTLAACGGMTTAGRGATPAPAAMASAVAIARPSNPGGPGAAASMIGDPQRGAEIFATNCTACHGDQGKVGVSNPGSTDGTVPVLNPIDETLQSKDPKVYAYNLDLFIQHGSTPGGDKPALKMAGWGDEGTLTQQQIADVIAYVVSLNPVK